MTADPVSGSNPLSFVLANLADFVYWLGRKVVYCYEAYGIPAGEAIVSLLKAQNGFVSFAIVGVGFLYWAMTTKDGKSCVSGRTMRVMCCAAAVLFFIASGYALSMAPGTVMA